MNDDDDDDNSNDNESNELCAKIVHGFQPLTIFGKSSILDV